MNKENKRLMISAGILGVFYVVYQIKKIKSIDIKVKNAEIKKLSFNQIDLILNILINNTSNINTTIQDIDYNVKLNDSVVLSNKQNINQIIKTGEKTIIPININFKPISFIKSIGKGLLKKGVNLEIDLKINLKALNIEWPFLINYKYKI